MAQIVGGGSPVNDAERRVIAHLRDNAPADWLLLHNIEVPRGDDGFEVDVLVLTGHSLCIIDVKGTRGRIEVAGTRWFPERRETFGSPVTKLRGNGRALKGLLMQRRRELERVYVDSLVVLTGQDAELVDPAGRDSRHVTDLAGLIGALSDVSRVRRGYTTDTTPYGTAIIEALNGSVRRSTAPPRFGNWQVEEQLGGDTRVTEYRAINATVPDSETVLLRVYRADPLAQEGPRAAERRLITNAYQALTRIPPHPCVVRARDFFAIDDESRFVLVLDDVHGQALHLHLTAPRQTLSTEARLDVVEDMLLGLAHVHANNVIHRALNPACVLVTENGRAMLTGFDYAKPGTRTHTVAGELPNVLDTHYAAPEFLTMSAVMTEASDVYAAGVIAFQLLTGRLPSAGADADPTAGGAPAEVMDVLRRMRDPAPHRRPTAAQALTDLRGARRPQPPSPRPPAPHPVGLTPVESHPPVPHPATGVPPEPAWEGTPRADGDAPGREPLFDKIRMRFRRLSGR
ncbi:serine/threonine protein kinase [Streptosporangium becharense]|uniref:Serine/threonine protein kinase n=1 Tax=Streptosporangium becharense TaxID=1816182 RepID=A0A7W9IL97_9ACTN|nr:NERD domain-containing protein kinase family protein [Streptosporangium becharense]MBB2911506.1 serine/threonine protein kinase [Streptosporangium becharense]MBB5822676.1 serine/threonine protein kinase [Streptosporangium becharense]